MGTANVMKTIFDEYAEQLPLYVTFTEKVKELVSELLQDNKIRVHSVTSRVKERTNLQKKLLQSERKYSRLVEITDIAGIRIITYFPDDVDLVAELIQKEFDINKDQSIDKRKLLDPDRFGYLSLHYVVGFSTNRLKLAEYRRFANCLAEIQIRSILQHAWAEIEHDLGYKVKLEVPRQIRRRFSRLAGLLEIADSEFVRIRDDMVEYEKTVPQQIIEAPESVLIDRDSLFSFIGSSAIVRKLDKEIASAAEAKIVPADVDFVRHHVAELAYVGVENIADLDSLLHQFEKAIVEFAKLWITPSKYPHLSSGISIGYMIYVLLGSKNSVDQIHDYLETFNYVDMLGSKDLAEKIISVYLAAI